VKIAMAQMNPTLGDFKGNAKAILKFAEDVKAFGAEMVVYPEMALFGYHPGDLLERPSIVEAQMDVLEELVEKLPKDLVCLLGCVQKNSGRGKPYYNSAVWIHEGQIQKAFHKQLLPVYDVFDDGRHFHQGSMKENTFKYKGKNFLVLVCEDMWGWDPLHTENPFDDFAAGDFDCIVNLSASPFTIEKRDQRQVVAQKTTAHLEAPLVYTNIAGAQDELIYDGGSFAMSSEGELLSKSKHFQEDLQVVDLATVKPIKRTPGPVETGLIRQALVLGVRDYVKKIGFQNVHLGLSGGIDSAVVACVAAEAVGPENLTCFSMPSEFNAKKSFTLAQTLCKNLGARFVEMPIQTGFQALQSSYEFAMGPREFSLVDENMQARLRGLLLMAYSNDKNSLLLTTGNKSEFAVGYTTLYGDMCGGLAVIGDLLKQQVFSLAECYTQNNGPMPRGIIDRPPSAELRPNQKDSDSLPDYDLLDAAVEKLVCDRQDAETVTEKWVLQRLMGSEFKRWQSPPILKVSEHAFGRGRRLPISHKARV